MVAISRTAEFRELCRAQPESKRRKIERKKWGEDEKAIQEERTYAEMYLKESYSILKHISTLTSMLASIRRPYLNLDASISYQRQPRNLNLSSEALASGETWAGIRYLTNEERDQIDLQARITLGKCADRVKQMELLEKRRASAAASNINPLIRLLPARLIATQDAVNADLISAHRNNIAWYLTRRLADASQNQKEMQEERLKRQSEKAKTLGSLAGPYDTLSSSPASRSTAAPSALSSLTSTFMRSRQTTEPPPHIESQSEESDDEDLDLSPQQIQQFEEENAAILRSVEDTLEAVQKAESRLLEISALQSELVVQLARQTEVVEHLYDEAIVTQSQVDKGHVQLKQARERAKSSRKWLLAFILGATMAILFLHWYD